VDQRKAPRGSVGRWTCKLVKKTPSRKTKKRRVITKHALKDTQKGFAWTAIKKVKKKKKGEEGADLSGPNVKRRLYRKKKGVTRRSKRNKISKTQVRSKKRGEKAGTRAAGKYKGTLIESRRGNIKKSRCRWRNRERRRVPGEK